MEIKADAPTPLDGILVALNYEEQQYGKSEIVDETAPSWLEQHPNGRRAHGIAGGAFRVKIPIDGYSPDDPMQILPPADRSLIGAYNRRGNPGRFQLRVVSKNSFDVIPTASSDGPQTPLLDTVMSFDATDDVGTQRSASSVKSCRAKPATPPSSAAPGRLLRIACSKRISSNITVYQPAREILRQMYGQVGSTDCWRLLYGPDSNRFWLRMR